MDKHDSNSREALPARSLSRQAGSDEMVDRLIKKFDEMEERAERRHQAVMFELEMLVISMEVKEWLTRVETK